MAELTVLLSPLQMREARFIEGSLLKALKAIGAKSRKQTFMCLIPKSTLLIRTMMTPKND